MRTRTRLTAALVAATVAAPSSGCGDIVTHPVAPPPCDWLTNTEPAEDAGRTVVLIDRSASTRGDGAPDYVAALGDLVTAAVDTHDVVSIGTFDGSASSVRWVGEDLVTDRGKRNPELRRDDHETAKRCLRATLSAAAGEEAVLPGSDVMGALTMGGRVLEPARGRKTLVVATDGLATTGCADLTRVVVGDHTALGPIGRLCARRAPADQDLSGVAVTMVGIGHPAEGRPQPSTLQLDWLASLWSALCAGTGAKPCDVRTTPVAVTPHTDASRAEGGPDDPDVALPAPERGVRRPDGSTRFQLDSQVLFEPNESTISPAGRASLAAVADSIRAAGAAEVTVDGYTEGQASRAANEKLARDRAREVQVLLAGLGIADVTATGHPDTAPDCAAADRQCKRRVDIVAR